MEREGMKKSEVDSYYMFLQRYTQSQQEASSRGPKSEVLGFVVTLEKGEVLAIKTIWGI